MWASCTLKSYHNHSQEDVDTQAPAKAEPFKYALGIRYTAIWLGIFCFTTAFGSGDVIVVNDIKFLDMSSLQWSSYLP